jgi:hypothetical protein
MSKNVTDLGTRSSAIAIAQEGSELKAVKLQRKGEAVEVLWIKSGEVKDGEWRSFIAECGLPTESAAHRRSRGDKLTVVGFGSTGVGFYRVGLPAVRKDEIPAMVRLQAETLLPLPAEQMEMSWRAGQVKNGEMPVTIAAARTEPLAGFVENVRCFEPESILLDCEGVVKAWRALFSGNARPAVVVSLAGRSTQVCLAEDGRLSNAVVLDIGAEDFCDTGQNPLLSADSDLLEQSVTTERFAQDMRSVLESFGYGSALGLPIYVLSDGGSAIEGIVSYLCSSGLNVTAVLPETRKLGGPVELGIEDAYRYRVPIGLALMALDDDTGQLNIFERVYNPAAAEEKRSLLYSPKVAVAIVAIMLAVLAIVSYALDVKSERHLGELQAQAGFKDAVQRQMLIKAVARQRPDLLELLSEISGGDENKGILLDSFNFKRGQSVTIRGQAPGNDQLYKFQENLLTKKGVKEAKILSAAPDSKTKKIKFTMTFHYKTYTKKSGRR